ncbi:hypothetical protein CEXT_47911 [Caerostris extrusa]|uniref:Uncharacterized protein n=1 Tax=Caerostris extrusa TaxID=172846 RepID=A0AAV4XII2_CAEEX|nr:hypothetical protein CEXT_47911 [Caerostris extrusa]
MPASASRVALENIRPFSRRYAIEIPGLLNPASPIVEAHALLPHSGVSSFALQPQADMRAKLMIAQEAFHTSIASETKVFSAAVQKEDSNIRHFHTFQRNYLFKFRAELLQNPVLPYIVTQFPLQPLVDYVA